jgi:hypothetical protein
MPKVTYNGNGNTGGKPPVDNNVYNSGDTVNVLEPFLPRDGNTTPQNNTIAGSLVRAGSDFAYWAAHADGSSPYYYWPGGGSTLLIGFLFSGTR